MDGGLANVVSFGAVGSERTLINVAPGAISATSTDAVNGGQIYANQASVVAALGARHHSSIRTAQFRRTAFALDRTRTTMPVMPSTRSIQLCSAAAA